uniref:Uncharacterized protein n=1 Tax=Palpitomonas bilix TaxID=652834 RepID=A0A7S3CZL8_9EUKA|mmetsp:Transcript_1601/g.3264  ORF Transcript_1601/g.3264 Transcript_1601/m.3264 type:complete len:398 (+) Transcript_1601:174-1367(+)
MAATPSPPHDSTSRVNVRIRILHWHNVVLDVPFGTTVFELLRTVQGVLYLSPSYCQVYSKGAKLCDEDVIEKGAITTVAVSLPSTHSLLILTSWRSCLHIINARVKEVVAQVTPRAADELGLPKGTKRGEAEVRMLGKRPASAVPSARRENVSTTATPMGLTTAFFFAPFGCLDCKVDSPIPSSATLRDVFESYCSLFTLSAPQSLVLLRPSFLAPPLLLLSGKELGEIDVAKLDVRGARIVHADVQLFEALADGEGELVVSTLAGLDSVLDTVDVSVIGNEAGHDKLLSIRSIQEESNGMCEKKSKVARRAAMTPDPLSILSERPKKFSKIARMSCVQGVKFDKSTKEMQKFFDSSLARSERQRSLGKGYSRFSPIEVNSSEKGTKGNEDDPIVID